MENSKKTLEFKLERTIPAPLTEVFDGAAEKFLLDPKVDGRWSSDRLGFDIRGYRRRP